jgi:hypothetical protein
LEEFSRPVVITAVRDTLTWHGPISFAGNVNEIPQKEAIVERVRITLRRTPRPAAGH